MPGYKKVLTINKLAIKGTDRQPTRYYRQPFNGDLGTHRASQCYGISPPHRGSLSYHNTSIITDHRLHGSRLDNRASQNRQGDYTAVRRGSQIFATGTDGWTTVHRKSTYRSSNGRTKPRITEKGITRRSYSSNYASIFLAKSGNKRCFRCLSTEHLRISCREPVRCFKCRRFGHCSRYCASHDDARKKGQRGDLREILNMKRNSRHASRSWMWIKNTPPQTLVWIAKPTVNKSAKKRVQEESNGGVRSTGQMERTREKVGDSGPGQGHGGDLYSGEMEETEAEGTRVDGVTPPVHRYCAEIHRLTSNSEAIQEMNPYGPSVGTKNRQTEVGPKIMDRPFDQINLNSEIRNSPPPAKFIRPMAIENLLLHKNVRRSARLMNNEDGNYVGALQKAHNTQFARSKEFVLNIRKTTKHTRGGSKIVMTNDLRELMGRSLQQEITEDEAIRMVRACGGRGKEELDLVEAVGLRPQGPPHGSGST